MSYLQGKGLFLWKKLAEAENSCAELNQKAKAWEKIAGQLSIPLEMPIGYEKMYEKMQKLESEAKAVRSKTIEECAKVADNADIAIGACMECNEAREIARAIRALNNVKE